MCNFGSKPDVEFSDLSKDTNIASIGSEPAALLNTKHDAPTTQCIAYQQIFDIFAKLDVFRLVLEGTAA